MPLCGAQQFRGRGVEISSYFTAGVSDAVMVVRLLFALRVAVSKHAFCGLTRHIRIKVGSMKGFTFTGMCFSLPGTVNSVGNFCRLAINPRFLRGFESLVHNQRIHFFLAVNAMVFYQALATFCFGGGRVSQLVCTLKGCGKPL